MLKYTKVQYTFLHYSHIKGSKYYSVNHLSYSTRKLSLAQSPVPLHSRKTEELKHTQEYTQMNFRRIQVSGNALSAIHWNYPIIIS